MQGFNTHLKTYRWPYLVVVGVTAGARVDKP
jgi:hypothetical protein